MAEAYTKTVLDHFRNPRNVGVMEHPDAVGDVENPVSGATLRLQLSVKEHRVAEARFIAQGCTATIASASILTELLFGRSVEDLRIGHAVIEEALGGLPPTKRHAARLAADAAESAVAALEAAGASS